MWSRLNLIAALEMVGALLLVPLAGNAAAPVILLADNGMLEHVYGGSGAPRADTVQFVWVPEGAPGSTAYALGGSCKRLNLNTDRPEGNFKAKFSRVTLIGLDSGKEVKGPNQVSKIKKGLPSQYAMWDMGTVGNDYAANDSAVLVAAQIKVSGQVQAGTYLQCFFGVIEGDAALFASASSAEEREAIFNALAQDGFIFHE